VIGIILGITSIAVAVLVPSVGERRLAETSRALAATLGGARSRALEIGRPVGVVLQRQQGLPRSCIALAYVEVPPPWGGGYPDSVVHLASADSFTDGNGNGVFDAGESLDDDWNGDGAYTGPGISGITTPDPSGMDSDGIDDLSWVGVLRNGDAIRFGYQGHTYRIYGPDADGDGYIDQMPPPTDNTPWVVGSETTWYVPATPYTDDPMSGVQGRHDPDEPRQGIPFQVFRQPEPSAAAAVQLPESACIDMEASNFGAMGPDVTIVFQPGGSVEAVYHGAARYRVNGTLALLCCRRDQLPDPVGDLLSWQDMTNRWITVNVATGKVGDAQGEWSATDPAINTLGGVRARLVEVQNAY
jgi:hypothetical protein